MERLMLIASIVGAIVGVFCFPATPHGPQRTPWIALRQ
jgi:hypothetical protein